VYFDYPVQVLSKFFERFRRHLFLASTTAQLFLGDFNINDYFLYNQYCIKKSFAFYPAFHHRWGHGSWKAGGKKDEDVFRIDCMTQVTFLLGVIFWYWDA